MILDGHIEGLLVSKEYWEPQHPNETPVVVYDSQTLRRTAPDSDLEGHNILVGQEYDVINGVYERAPYAVAMRSYGTVT
jgi:hypothetical protein